MPSFLFSARDGSGRPQSGTLTAGSPGDVTAQLRSRGWIVLDVQSASAKSGLDLFARLNPAMWLPATSFDVEVGLQQIATMLRSGLTLMSAIKTASEQVRRPAMGEIWREVYARIEAGSSFTEALRAHPRHFPEYVVQLVKVGEASGQLEVVLNRAAEHLERGREMRVKLFNALMYPAIVLIMAVGVAIFMLVGIIPKLQKFLSARGRRLPAMTQMLLDFSTWFQLNGTYVLIGFVGVVVGLVLMYKAPSGRMIIDRFLLRVPLIGKLFRLSATAMFARSLSLLLESGVTLLEGLQTVENLISNRALSSQIGMVRHVVLQGGTLAAPLIAKSSFMPMLGRMAAIGEETGTLDPVLKEVANFHEKQFDALVRRLSVLIEPAVIVVVGGVVGFVYIAFFLALFSLAG